MLGIPWTDMVTNKSVHVRPGETIYRRSEDMLDAMKLQYFNFGHILRQNNGLYESKTKNNFVQKCDITDYQ